MRLVLNDSAGHRRVFPVDKDELIIGRLPSNEIVVDGTFVSRQHTKIIRRGKSAYAQDMGSRNGTFVNDQRIRERQLADGDRVSVGNNIFTFEERVADEVKLADDALDLSSEGTLIRSIEQSSVMSGTDIKGLVTRVKDEQPATGIVQIDAAELSTLRQEARNLRIVHEVAQQLTASVSLPELLERVMNLVNEVIPSDRAYLLLLDEKTGGLIPTVVKFAGEDADAYKGEEIQISRTITNTVIENRAAVRTSNASDEFEGAKSIMSFGISSVLAVPMWQGNKVIGVIYLDSAAGGNVLTGEVEEVFPEYSLDLLTTIGHQAALFITQARLMESFRKEQEQRAYFARFLSPSVADYLVAEGLEDGLLPTEVEATILFSDIQGFTSWSETVGDPKTIAAALNEYFGLMTEVVFEHNGTLDKFIGDAVMALFGVPASSGTTASDAANAVRAGAKMFDELARLNQDRPDNMKFNIRVGINTGSVVAGKMGSVKRPEYTVLGDPVNMASRIENLATPGCVFVGAPTYELVKDEFSFTDMGTFEVKGKAEQQRLYRLDRGG